MDDNEIGIFLSVAAIFQVSYQVNCIVWVLPSKGQRCPYALYKFLYILLFPNREQLALNSGRVVFIVAIYRIRGLFGGDFNMAVWRLYWFAKFKSRRFNLHTRNELIYLPFHQIKMMPTLFSKQFAKYLTRQ